MELRTAYQTLIQRLSPQYGEGEARAISRIYFEDAWQWKAGMNSREISTEEQQKLDDDFQRLVAGEPVQYVVELAYFYGRLFRVGPDVLIPRPETEELVAWALDLLDRSSTERVIDIGTGSGCIPVTLKLERPGLEVLATDVSPAALALARANATHLGADIGLLLHDILQPAPALPGPAYGLVVSNPPYIPRQESALMPDHVLRHEPHLALFVEGEDPLLFYRRIAAAAHRHLRAGGYLLFECNEYNAREVARLLPPLGFANIMLRQDLQGKDRMVGAIRS